MIRRLLPLLLLAAALLPAAAPAGAAAARAGGFAGTVRLDGCSASLVRWPTSRPGDRALLLTAGHCASESLAPGETIADRRSRRTGTVLSRSGAEVGTVRTSRLLYATTDRTDVALYRLGATFRAVRRSTGVRPLTLASQGPGAGAMLRMPSAALGVVYRCQVQAVVPTLQESGRSWNGSVRMAPGDPRCQTVGGTSGSPLVDRRTGLQVGVNNTISPDDLTACRSDQPCEVGTDGSRTAVRGRATASRSHRCSPASPSAARCAWPSAAAPWRRRPPEAR